MLNIGTGELIFIAIAALLILGPKKLPEFARTIGKLVRDFRRQTDDVRHVVEREFYKMDQELTAEHLPQPALESLPQDAALPPSPEMEHDSPHHDPMHRDAGTMNPHEANLPAADSAALAENSQVLRGANPGEPVAVATAPPPDAAVNQASQETPPEPGASAGSEKLTS